jgi:organic hydroperoxide reductase OsmC/OhrA
MPKQHNYPVTVTWTGNNGTGTSAYDAYERSHTISVVNKPDLPGSADTPFRGDNTKYNPEDMLVASLSTCHMLWYLHLCADAGIIVTGYEDNATGIMVQPDNGPGHFTEVTLNPIVTVTEDHMINKANDLHDKAHDCCFIANSMNFPVHHKPTCKTSV